jgi:hypothetical protein
MGGPIDGVGEGDEVAIGKMGVSGGGGAVLGLVLLASCVEVPVRKRARAPQGQAADQPAKQLLGPALSHVVSVSHHEAMSVALAVDDDGELFVAHRPSPGDQLVVSQLDPDGTAWVTIGGALNQRPVAHLVTLAFDRQGALHAAFLEEEPSGDGYQLVVRRMNDGAWSDCAQRLGVGKAHFYFKADLAFDAANHLLLAYTDDSGRLQVKRRDRDGWTSLAALGSLRYGVRMVMKPDGQPAVAYVQAVPDSDEATLEVIAREGDRWVPVGTVVDRSAGLGDLLSPPRLAWDAGGAWLAWSRGSAVNVARHAGTDWQRQVFTPTLQARNGRIAMALVEGGPLVASGIDIGFGTRVRRFRGGVWGPELDATPEELTRGLGTGPIVAAAGSTAYLAFPSLGAGDRCLLEQLEFAPEIE